jgi:hypothetical protein
MAALTNTLSTITPKAYEGLTKFVVISRTDTTAFKAVELPKYAIPVGFYVLGQAASNAATTATISVGTSATATELISGYDVLTAASAVGYNVAGNKVAAGVMGKQLTADTVIYAKYAETGTASTAGGPWIVKIEYIVPGPGEKIAG